MAERCLVCNGSKTHAPMGGIMVKCKACDGVGYVSDEKLAENRAKMQTVYPKADNSPVPQNQVIANSVPITPIVAPESTIKADPLAVSVNDIEAIKAKMLSENAMHPSQMDKRTSAYKVWKASEGK